MEFRTLSVQKDKRIGEELAYSIMSFYSRAMLRYAIPSYRCYVMSYESNRTESVRVRFIPTLLALSFHMRVTEPL